MFEETTISAVELEHIQLIFLERAVSAMRDVGMTDRQIDEALGRHDSEPAAFLQIPI